MQRDASVGRQTRASVAAEEVRGLIETPLHIECTNLARAEKTSNFVVLLTAIATVLYRARGQDDIAFQSRFSLRARPALARMIGPVGTSIVMRFDMTGNPTFKQLIARVRNVMLTSWSNAEVPIVDRVSHGVRRLNVNYAPNVDENTGPEELAPGLTVTHMPTPLEIARVQIQSDIQLWIHDGTNRCRMRMVYLPELFERATMVGIVDAIVATLAEICQDPNRNLAG